MKREFRIDYRPSDHRQDWQLYCRVEYRKMADDIAAKIAVDDYFRPARVETRVIEETT